MSEQGARHAVVIGASMSGLLAARVLSAHFERVTVLERDEVTAEALPRKGQPHARHLHSLLAQGLAIFERFFPGLRQDLCAGGALLGDMGADMRWYASGGYRRQFESGMTGVLMTRAFLEQCVRRRVAALPNVTIRSRADVDQPLADGARVAGVRLDGEGASPEVVEADLVVDASGRGTATPKWMEALGYGRPEESAVKINMGYSTRMFRRQEGDLQGAKLVLVSAHLPQVRRSGYVFPVEGERWMATLGGWGGEYPPADEAGFLDHARGLAAPDVHDLLARLEPLGDIIQHRLPSNLRRHYERMRRWPERYLVMGDAVASFNPVYAQGMTSAAMQAAVLDEVLSTRRNGLDGLRERYFPRVAAVVDMAWRLAVCEDFRATTTGPKPPGTDIVNTYVARVHRATHVDPSVYRMFLDVMNLVKPATSLLRPRAVWRVMRAAAR
ncbi:MAG TPA: FAD-dependent monooxygenase [Vicinamibacteria bacterium]|nr:FAD-dependent monooxygenase [Vicinamibacteria bacterium]